MFAFRHLVRQDPNACLLMLNNVIVECNNTALEMFGCSDKSDLMDLSLVDLIEDPQPDGKRILESGSLLNAALNKPEEYVFYMHPMSDQEAVQDGFWARVKVFFLDKKADKRMFLVRLEKQTTVVKHESPSISKYSLDNKLFRLLELLPDAVIHVDVHRKLMYANIKAKQLLSNEWQLQNEENFESNASFLIKKFLHEPFERTIQNKVVQHTEIFIPDSASWWQIKFIPELHSDGEVSYVIWSSKDVTALKTKQEAIIRSKEDFRTMAEYAPDVIVRYDSNLRYTYISPNFEKYLEIPLEDLLGKGVEEVDFLPADILNAIAKALRRLFKTGQAERLTFKVKDVWIDWYGAPIIDADGQVTSAIATSRDITGYKNIQKELEIYKAKMLFALDVARLAFFKVDPKDGAFYMDERLARIHGLDPEEFEGEKIRFSEFLSLFKGNEKCTEEALDFFGNSSKASKTSEFSCEYETVVNGKTKYLVSKSKVVRNSDGEIRSWFGIVQDVTDLKGKEKELINYRQKLQDLVTNRTESLKRSEESLEDAMKLARLGTWEYDPVLRQFSGDEQIAEMLGIWNPGQKVYTVPVEEYLKLVHPLDYSAFEAASRKAFHARSPGYVGHVEHRVTHANGEVHYIYFSIKFLIDTTKGKKLKFYGIAQDVTSIWESETEVEMLSTILETTPDIVLAFDEEFQLTYINKSGKLKLNMGPLDDINSFSVLNEKGGHYLNLVSRDMFNHVKTTGHWQGEIEWVGKDTFSKFFIGSIKKFEFSDFKTTYLSIFRDITEQKKVARDLKFKQDELDAYISKASNDLKGPVSALISLNDKVENEVHDPKLQLYLEMFKNEVDKLYNILLSLIDMSNIRSAALQSKEVDIFNFVKQCVTGLSFHQDFEHAKIEIYLDCPDHVVLVPALYRVIFYNLLKNALDFKNPEGKPDILITVKKEGEYLITEVKDNGQGMKEDVKSRATDMFYRGNAASKGSGLGLYMVKMAVNRLNGQVDLFSEAGKGTLVKINVRFPINQNPSKVI